MKQELMSPLGPIIPETVELLGRIKDEDLDPLPNYRNFGVQGINSKGTRYFYACILQFSFMTLDHVSLILSSIIQFLGGLRHLRVTNSTIVLTCLSVRPSTFHGCHFVWTRSPKMFAIYLR